MSFFENTGKRMEEAIGKPKKEKNQKIFWMIQDLKSALSDTAF